MSILRIVLTALLIIPLGMIIYASVYPDWQWDQPGLEYVFLILGLPILILNYFAWFQPDILQAYIPIKGFRGQRMDEKTATRALVISAIIFVILLGAGVVSALSRALASALRDTPTAQLAELTAFPTFLPLATRTSIASETPEAAVFAATPTGPASTAGIGTEAITVTVEGTATSAALAACSPALADHLEAVSQAIEASDPDNEVETGWSVRSGEISGLTFVAAKVHGPEIAGEVTEPGVWGLFAFSEGGFDIYAINPVAQEYSYTAWGEDYDPVISMETDGAQEAYNCALNQN